MPAPAAAAAGSDRRAWPAGTRDCGQALAESHAMAALGARLRGSRARWEALATALPAGLRAQLQPGPLDDEGWSLLAAHPAAAAKLRQLQPRLQAVLEAAGLGAPPLRIKLLAPGR